MFRNYLKTAFRNFRKNRSSSLINLFGLSIGLTCCMLIALYIKHELSYDGFQKKGERIARVIMEYSFDGSPESNKGNYTSVRVAPVFQRNFPEIESTIRMTMRDRVIHFTDKYEDKYLDEKKFAYADSTFFDLFSFRLLQGDPKKVLSAPYDVVLTVSSAKKYFGTESPIGKTFTITMDTAHLYRVTGLMEDCPSNSQIKFNMVTSFSSMGLSKEYEQTYWDANYTTYLLLKDHAAIAGLQAKLPSFMKKEMKGQGATVNFYLEPFKEIHLHSPYPGFEPNNNISYVYILGAVALLILVIVCSTYINLSTARSIERAREVGVRKVVGAENGQLFWQFIGESALICLMAITLSLGTATLLLPYFNQLADKDLSLLFLFSPSFLFFLLLLAILITLLAGCYPSLILSGFQPVRVLKGSFKNSTSGQWLRKSLLIFQFAISVFLIISAIVIQKQLFYIQHKDLGYDRSHVLVMPATQSLLKNLALVKNRFKENPGVISVSNCNRSPVEGGGGYGMRSEQMTHDQVIAVTANNIDEDFVKTIDLRLVAGTDINYQDMKDVSDTDWKKRTYHFILNESAAGLLGWKPQEAIGKKMFLGDNRPGYVSGVVRDFHFQSMHDPIKAYIGFTDTENTELLVKISGQNISATLGFLESKWKELAPARPFEYRFMDEDYNQLYNAEIRLGKVMNLFSGIAILLACLGLYGLSSYAAQQRTREVGIRKVLGASIRQIVFDLSMDFIKPSLLAILIAFPFSWWALHKWLESYVYRIDISWLSFLTGGMIIILLAIFTVSIHAFRAALTNPVRSLRTE